LEALLRLNHLDEAALRDRLTSIHDPEVDNPWEHQDEWIEAALDRLAEVELDPAQLTEIEPLDFAGGNDRIMLLVVSLDPHTGRAADPSQPGSLAGIERLTGLQVPNLAGHGSRKAALDLGPLRDHPALQRLLLSGKCSAAQALEHMPALAEVDIGLGSV